MANKTGKTQRFTVCMKQAIKVHRSKVNPNLTIARQHYEQVTVKEMKCFVKEPLLWFIIGFNR